MTNNIRHAAQHFEVVLTQRSSKRDGTYFHFVAETGEVPAEVMMSRVGTRYLITLIELPDAEEPNSKYRTEAERAVTSAAMLCKEPDFQRWLVHEGICNQANEEAAAIGLRQYLGITSRSELTRNERALAAFLRLRNDFERFQLTR